MPNKNRDIANLAATKHGSLPLGNMLIVCFEPNMTRQQNCLTYVSSRSLKSNQPQKAPSPQAKKHLKKNNPHKLENNTRHLKKKDKKRNKQPTTLWPLLKSLPPPVTSPSRASLRISSKCPEIFKTFSKSVLARRGSRGRDWINEKRWLLWFDWLACLFVLIWFVCFDLVCLF